MSERPDAQEIRRIQRELIGQRYGGADLSGIALEAGISRQVLDWIKNRKNFLVYLGAPGCGKTYFCAAMIPWVYKKVRSFRFWNEGDMFSRIRSLIATDAGEYLKEISYLLDDEFVMIDDLGSSGFNEWRKEILLTAINERYESMLPTIFTSNLTKKQIYEGLGARSHSRLFSKENTIIELHDAPDLRQKECKSLTTKSSQ